MNQQHATDTRPLTASPANGRANGVPDFTYRVPQRTVWESVFPGVLTLPVRLGLLETDPQRQERIAESLALDVYRYHFGSPRQRASADRRLSRDAELLTPELGADIYALALRVGQIEARLRRAGVGRERPRETRVVTVACSAVAAEMAFMSLRSAQLNHTLDAIVFLAFTIFVLGALVWNLAHAFGFNRALWLAARDSNYADAAFDHVQDAERRAQEAERLQALAPCDLTLDLPPHIIGEGYLYVIEFSTGAVKVGMTEDPRRRIGEHRRDADAFKVAITNFWISSSHRNFRHNELLLIAQCAQISARSRLEYFHEITFSQAVEIAAGLPFKTKRRAGGAR